jgi:hypothetical protein
MSVKQKPRCAPLMTRFTATLKLAEKYGNPS